MRIFLPMKRHLLPKITTYTYKDFGFFFRELQKFKGPVAIDFETSGLDPFTEGAYIRSVGVANNPYYCIALDFKELPISAKQRFWQWTSSYTDGFLAHNAVFDLSWAKLHGSSIPIYRCTATMFRNVSNEGYPGQSWSLKTAMTEVLGWKEVNNLKLKDWLKTNNLKEKDMHLAPWDVIGPYNALDAGATYQLYNYINQRLFLSPFNEIMQGYWNCEIKTIINEISEQYVQGITIDKEKLRVNRDSLTKEMDDYYNHFVSQEEVAKGLLAYNQTIVDELQKKEPTKFIANGEIGKNWIKFQEKLTMAKETNHFNVDSGTQLQWLFFDYLKITPGRFVEKKTSEGKRVKTDNPSVDKKALPLLGSITRPLINYRKVRDVRKFATAMLNVSVNSKIHPFLTVSGTVTGRQSGGLRDAEGESDKKFNIQNIANDIRLFEPMVAPVGYKIIYFDFSSLEPHVMCEFSKDSRLRELYLSGSCHDLYLWYGANTKKFGPAVREYYPADNPTPELVSKAKKDLKELRKALKIMVLGLGYNMGAKKLMEDINDQTDFVLTLAEAEQLKREYFRFFSGIKSFMDKIEHLFVVNDERFILNGRGRPLFNNRDRMARSKLPNKFVQSTGHDCLQLYIFFIKERLKTSDIELKPYHVDLHDATSRIFLDTPENEAKAKQVYLNALQDLNDALGWEVKLKGVPKTGYSFSEFLD